MNIINGTYNFSIKQKIITENVTKISNELFKNERKVNNLN